MGDFPLRAPHAYVSRIERGNPEDPLLLQVLPLPQELEVHPGYTEDPLEESDSNPCPGLIHKYHGRVLLILSSSCAIHCRYCFRRHFPYQANTPSKKDWQQALTYIHGDTSITEVIYSGGDPLASNDRQLQWLTEQIASIPHVKRLRIHSRLPIVIPDRITPQLLQWLTATRLQTSMVVHCNHPNEIDAAVGNALYQLKIAGVTLLNQTVLLNGINNCSNTLTTLSDKLFSHGVLPYYLHLLDKVAGAAHFDVSDTEAIALHNQLMNQLPGYLTPRLVRESPHFGHKVPIGSLLPPVT